MKKLFAIIMLLGFASPAMAYHIGGMVFCDSNLNGVFDGDDVPLGGVTVQASKDSFLASDTTAGDGTYEINLQPVAQGDSPGVWNVTIVAGLNPGAQFTAKNVEVGDTLTPLPGEPSAFVENVNFAIDDPACQEELQGACWMTAGGVKFEPVMDSDAAEHGPKDSFGGVVYPSCSSEPSNGGQWNHVAHSLQLHFQGTDISVIRCGNVDDPNVPPGSESPVTPFNFIEFEGIGWIQGIKGNKLPKSPAVFTARVEDRNEPGNESSAAGEDIDRYRLLVTSPGGEVYFEIGDVDPQQMITITGGNLQLHSSSCDN